jgi:hypothetical protein
MIEKSMQLLLRIEPLMHPFFMMVQRRILIRSPLFRESGNRNNLDSFH